MARRICSCSRWNSSRCARFAAGAEEPQTVRRGMMKRPRYSRKRRNCGLPVASAISQWKAKSWSTAILAAVDGGARWPSIAVGDLLDLRRRGALGGKAGGLDFDAGAQLHDIEHLAQRRMLVEIDPERPAHLLGDEGADALAGHHQPVGAQGRDRLADHGAANPGRGDHFLLGRQPRAGRQLAAGDIGGQPRHQLRRSAGAARRAAAAGRDFSASAWATA